MTPREGVLMLGRGHISHYSEYASSSINRIIFYQYIAHWLLYYWGIIMLFSYDIVDFHLFYDGDIDMLIWIMLIRNQYRVSAIQVTVKAYGPLLRKNVYYIKFMMNRQVILNGTVYIKSTSESLLHVYWYDKQAKVLFVHILLSIMIYSYHDSPSTFEWK